MLLRKLPTLCVEPISKTTPKKSPRTRLRHQAARRPFSPPLQALMCRQRLAGFLLAQRPRHLRRALLPRQSPQALRLEVQAVVVETPVAAVEAPVAAETQVVVAETQVAVVGAHHLTGDFTLVSLDCSLGLATLRQAIT